MSATADQPRASSPGPDDGDESLFENLVEELTDRLQAGDRVDVESFLARHPAQAERLRRLIPSLELIDDLGQWSIREGNGVGPPPTDPAAGLGELGDFRLIREVGRGGMGIVYEAEQISLRRRVALKVLPFASALDGRQIQRFQIEAQAAACLHHPHIVPVHGVGCDRGVHYYAMQLIEGQSLAAMIAELRRLDGLDPSDGPALDLSAIATSDLAARLLSGGRPGTAGSDEPTVSLPAGGQAPEAPTPRVSRTRPDRTTTSGTSTRNRDYIRGAARLALQAAEALDHAHTRGILHRDIKPGNLLLDAEGRLWVTDFGLAQVRGDDRLTITGDVLGTLRYMSPEQALGLRVVIDGRTDVYSLGVTLYELLTLRPAVDGRDRAEILRKIADEEMPSLRKLNQVVPADLETIVLKATARDPSGRYATAQELAEDLQNFLEDRPIRARRPGLLDRAARLSRRHRSVVMTAALLLVLGTAVSTWQAIRATRAERRVGAALKLAEERSRLARRAVDEMYSQFANDVLAGQPRATPVQRRFLEKALAYYQGFARDQGDDPEIRYDVAEAYRALGSIQQRLGPTTQTEVALRRALELSKQLAADFPGVPKYRELLGNCYNSLCEAGTEDSSEKERYYRQSLAIWEALAADPATRSNALVTQVKIYYSMGMILYERGHFSEAEENVRRSVALLQKHSREFPEAATDKYLPAGFWWRDSAGPYPFKGQPDQALLLGQILREIGRLDDAERVFREGLAPLEKLLNDPAAAGLPVTDYFRGIRVTLEFDLGDLLRQKGRTREAEEVYRRGLALSAELVAKWPDEPLYRLKQQVAENRLGVLLAGIGRTQEAEEAYRRALALGEELVARWPDAPRYRHNLQDTESDLGVSLAGIGRTREAEEAYRRALARGKELVARWPDVPAYRHFQQVTENRLGVLLAGIGRTREAEEAYRRSLARGKELVARWPDVPDYRDHQQVAEINLGVSLARIGRTREAEEAYRRALARGKELVARWPDVPAYLHFQQVAEEGLGGLLTRIGRTREAEETFRRSLARGKELVARWPDVPDYRDRQQMAEKGLGELLAGIGRTREAEEAYRRAVALGEELVARRPNVPHYRYHQQVAENRLGELLAGIGRTREAEEAYRRAVALGEELVARWPDVPHYRYHQQVAENRLGVLLAGIGQTQEAEEASRRAVALGEELVARWPDVPFYRSELALALRNWGIGTLKNGRLREAGQAYRRSLELWNSLLAKSPDDVEVLWNLIDMLTNWPIPYLRDPTRAVELTRKAIDKTPNHARLQRMLGSALYRAGDWRGAVAALGKSMELSNGGDAYDSLFLAMANWQLGEHGRARAWYGRSVEWLDRNRVRYGLLERLRSEAAALLALADLPDDVFARP